MGDMRDWGDDMALGVGYDAVANQVRGDCVIRSPTESTGGEEVYFAIDIIESREDLVQKLNISASASLTAEFGTASAKISYFDDKHINKYSLYLLCTCVVKQSAERMRDVKLSDDAARMISSGNTDGFRRRCGDEFVVGSVSGGELYGFCEIITQSEDEQRDASASIRGSGSLGTWSASAGFEDAVTKLSQKFQLQFRVFSQGGASTAPLPNTAAELIEYARNFPTMIRATPKRYVATFQEYDTLNLPAGPSLIDIASQKDTLQSLASLRLEYLDLISSIEYLLDNPEQFDSFVSSTFNDKANLFRDAVNRITDRARDCVRDYNLCKLLTDLPDSTIILPNRRDSTVIGAIKLAQEAALRAQSHADACIASAKEVLDTSRTIVSGPQGKEMADKAQISLANARTSEMMAENALADARSVAEVTAEVSQWKDSAASAVKQAQDALRIGTDSYAQCYAIGYAPFWSAPTVFHLTEASGESGDGYKSTVLYLGDNTNTSLVDETGYHFLNLESLINDPSGGDVTIGQACSNPASYVDETYCPVGSLPIVRYSRFTMPCGVRISFFPDHGNIVNTLTFGVAGISDAHTIQDHRQFADKVYPAAIILTSKKSGLRTLVTFQLLCFSGRKISDSYIQGDQVVTSGHSPLFSDKRHQDSHSNLGWIGTPLQELRKSVNLALKRSNSDFWTNTRN